MKLLAFLLAAAFQEAATIMQLPAERLAERGIEWSWDDLAHLGTVLVTKQRSADLAADLAAEDTWIDSDAPQLLGPACQLLSMLPNDSLPGTPRARAAVLDSLLLLVGSLCAQLGRKISNLNPGSQTWDEPAQQASALLLALLPRLPTLLQWAERLAEASGAWSQAAAYIVTWDNMASLLRGLLRAVMGTRMAAIQLNPAVLVPWCEAVSATLRSLPALSELEQRFNAREPLTVATTFSITVLKLVGGLAAMLKESCSSTINVARASRLADLGRAVFLLHTDACKIVHRSQSVAQSSGDVQIVLLWALGCLLMAADSVRGAQMSRNPEAEPMQLQRMAVAHCEAGLVLRQQLLDTRAWEWLRDEPVCSVAAESLATALATCWPLVVANPQVPQMLSQLIAILLQVSAGCAVAAPMRGLPPFHAIHKLRQSVAVLFCRARHRRQTLHPP